MTATITDAKLSRREADQGRRALRRALAEANGVYPRKITHGRSGWNNYFCRCDICATGHRDGVTKQKPPSTPEEAAAVRKRLEETRALRRERFVGALTRLTLASDTDALGIELDTDDMDACEGWLEERPVMTAIGMAVGGRNAQLARAAVLGAITAGGGKRSTRSTATIPGRELADYVRLLHDTHAATRPNAQVAS